MHFFRLNVVRLFCLLLIGCVGTVWGGTAATTLVDKTERAMAPIRTLTATFRQEKNLPMLQHTLILHGTFALDRQEGRMTWRVHEPIRFACVISKDRLTQWDADSDREKTITAQDHAALKFLLHMLQTYFAGDFRKMSNDFELSSPSPLVLKLIPKKHSAAASFIQENEFHFAADYGHVTEVHIREHGGTITRILFSQVKRNAKLPPDTWKAKF